jgi:hypothetical protein
VKHTLETVKSLDLYNLKETDVSKTEDARNEMINANQVLTDHPEIKEVLMSDTNFIKNLTSAKEAADSIVDGVIYLFF